MNGCKGCIAYRLHHGLVEPEICMDCGEKTLIWKQGEGGTFYLECNNCFSLVGVDLNTPCEMDHKLFDQKALLIIEPQEQLPQNTVILKLGKIFSLECCNRQVLMNVNQLSSFSGSLPHHNPVRISKLSRKFLILFPLVLQLLLL